MKNLLLTLLLCMGVQPVYSQLSPTAKMDTYLDLLGKNNQSIGKVMVHQRGELLYSASFGPEGLEKYEPDNLKYRVGSISKLLTAILTFSLQEEGLVNLDETIDTYFPDVPNARLITISHLLSHTSGLKDVVTKDETLYNWLFQPVKKQELMDEIIRQGTLFEPGTNTRYSNSGYYLLGLILERKTNQTYQQLLKNRILTPLGLTRTVASAPDSPDIAVSYKYNHKNKKWQKTEDFYFPNVTAFGDVASTPKELIIIINALFSGKLVSLSSLKQMKPVNQQSFGKGMALVPFYEKVFYGHSGGTFGAYSMVMYNEQDKLSVAVTINGQEMNFNELLIGILSILYNKEFALPVFSEPEEPGDTNLTLFEGVYSSESFPLKLTVFVKEGELYFQGTGQPSFPVNQQGRNKFIKKDILLEAEFVPEEGLLKFSQSGYSWELRRE